MSRHNMAHGATLGHVVTVCHPCNGRRRELPALTIGGLALELAGMIRDALPAALVCIVRVDLRPTEREQAEQQTHAIKRQVSEAREAEQPGHAFLAATGFWPTAKQE
ncbi:hypothetical protein H7683_03830 [Ectopseudomonas mendocina]|uniref:hypothetical protein n=1 Tax=Ectopseudomonas mendocina TaxID=300 RepID=UPI001AE0955E|nr:hypothetical protein [Pseudomonas mendocina]QTN46772.1 hypothetical protein H7683_03830 [Pseudomonas mendocina]